MMQNVVYSNFGKKLTIKVILCQNKISLKQGSGVEKVWEWGPLLLGTDKIKKKRKSWHKCKWDNWDMKRYFQLKTLLLRNKTLYPFPDQV